MYLHLGNDIAVRTGDIIGIFDFDYCSIDKRARLFLTKAQRNGEIIDVTGFTGGFNLTIAFATGYSSGKSIQL